MNASTVCVHDEGAGIDAAGRSSPFPAYERLSAQSRGPAVGTGPGLRIKRALAEPMDVNTGVDRATRTGSAFSLALPVTQIRPEESTARTFNYPVTGNNGSLAAAATG